MFVRRYRRGVVLAAAVGPWAAPHAFAGDVLTTLASFNSSDGGVPIGGLILSGNNLYGTTKEGGTNSDGTVFSLPVTGGTPTVLASFNGSNGESPYAGLTLSGNTLYGTTETGGPGGLPGEPGGSQGTVFSVPITGAPPTVLASFNGSNGYNLYAGVTLSGNTLYGIASMSSSAFYSYGKVFSVPVTGGIPTVLATFNGSDGSYPVASLTLSGNTLYGTSGGGGANSDGAVFSIPLTGGTPKVLASFNGSNGAGAGTGVILVGNTLYGTTEQGGANGYGTVFSVPVAGGMPTVLASLLGSCGQIISSGLTLVGNTFYGTNGNGGPYDSGAIYSVPLTGGTPTILASFNGFSDGELPSGDLTLSGNTLYGTTIYGGATGYGTVFSLALTNLGGVTVYSGLSTHFLSNVSTGIQVVPISGVAIQATGIGIVDSGTSHSNRQLLVINSPGLSIAGSAGNWTGTLDLRDNDLDLPGASLASVTSQVAQGYSNGKWNGPGGIISSVASADTTHLTAIGVIQNNQGGTPLYTASNPFDTITPGATDILVKYTYYGDANLSGSVDASDYSLIDNGYLNQLTGWYNGDFNYDGVVNGSDYTLIDNAFNMQGASLADQASPSAVATNQFAAGASVVAVPEPACLGFLTVGSLGLLRHRRLRQADARRCPKGPRRREATSAGPRQNRGR